MVKLAYIVKRDMKNIQLRIYGFLYRASYYLSWALAIPGYLAYITYKLVKWVMKH